MLKYLIQTVQTLFIPSVLLSMLYPILIENEDNAENKKCFFIFCLTALCAVLIFTILKRNTNLINREFFNLAVSSIYIVSALTFIFTKFVFLQK
ncbi:MAG: hypothetical protein LBT79_07025, partial [Elusimicrobiota bacterium]|nr:hypothetical protein [Elusimicrobiota bacterium]